MKFKVKYDGKEIECEIPAEEKDGVICIDANKEVIGRLIKVAKENFSTKDIIKIITRK